MLTADTISDHQIRQVRIAALGLRPADWTTVDLCNRALTDDIVDDDGNEIAFSGLTPKEARQHCADVINSAEDLVVTKGQSRDPRQ
jgi:hypothetical protein